MKRPTLTLPVMLSAGDVLAARESGMVPNNVGNALWAALEKVGPLELEALRQDWAEWNARKDAENDRKLGRSAEEGAGECQ